MREKIYTTFEVSRFCHVDISTVMGWVDDGKLRAQLERDARAMLGDREMEMA